jgi:hypothetical protein
MSTVPASVPADALPIPGAQDRPWYIVGRWQEYQGEARANLLRLAAVAAFYVIELINYYGVDLGFSASSSFRRSATWLSTRPSPR